MAFTHNSKLADSEPSWGSLDKTKLPRNAHADMGDPSLKSFWRFPHHWIQNGGGINEDGIFTTGTMYLHEGGLNAAWSRANQAQVDASAAVKAHIQMHRKALGKTNTTENASDTSGSLSINVSTLSSYAPKDVTFEGKAHVAVPVSLLTEGVHAGSKGPMLYSKEELAKFPVAWNGVPVPVNHPATASGEASTCNSPIIIEKLAVGRVWNCTFEGNKLRGEMWINVEKAQDICPDTLSRIYKGEPIEISTGLYSDEIPITGSWNGEQYIGKVINIRPDHVAILPNAKGACSIEDGCGIGVNSADKGGGKVLNKKKIPFSTIRHIKANVSGIDSDMAKKLYTRFLLGLSRVPDVVANVVIDGKFSFEDVRDQLWSYMYGLGSDDASYYIRDVYPDKFIYEEEPKGGKSLQPRYYSQPYTISTEGEVEISGTPTEVIYKEEYIPLTRDTEEESPQEEAPTDETETVGAVQEQPDTNQLNQTQRGKAMDKDKVTQPAPVENEKKHSCSECEAVITKLIGNTGDESTGSFTAADREWLTQMPLTALKKLLPVENKTETVQPAQPAVPTQPVQPVQPAQTANMQSDPLAGMPESVRAIINDAISAKEAKKEELISEIVSNTRNTLSKDQLHALPVEVLSNMACLSPKPSYIGAAGAVIPINTNSGITPLGIPSLQQAKQA